MAYNSQFIMYTSNDNGHPVLTSGTSGSLLSLLNSCLITGYGSKPGAGWTKTGSLGVNSGLPDSASCGILCMPTGSQATLFIIDNAPGAGGLREARATGFDYVNSFTASYVNSSVTGSNQFPTLTQLAVGNGAVVIRKSTDISSTERQWIMFADSSSMYLFINPLDTAGVYGGAFAFGDIYSLRSGSTAPYKAMIAGRIAEAAANTATNDRLDQLNVLGTVTTGHFLQRSFSGTGIGITIGKHGDGVKGSTSLLIGVTQYPNAADNGLYISPVWIHDANFTLQGTMRGFYHTLHAVGSFSDGQMFNGAGDYAGRTFYMVKQSSNSGVYLIETSATVQTN